MLLVVLASTQCVLLIVLSVLVLTNWAEAAHPTSPNSRLNIKLTPTPTNPGSTVQVSGNLPLQGGTIWGTQCTLSSSDASVFQGQPTCTLGVDGTINGVFQVSISSPPGDYTISVGVLFDSPLPYSEYWNCSPENIAEYTITTTEYGGGYSSGYATTSILSSLAYSCQVDDSGTLKIRSTPSLMTTTTTASNTQLVYVTITRTSTTTTTEEIRSQLTVPEAVLTASATATVTAVATRIYAKRRPGFAFDVEVRHGIDREESSD